MRSKKIQFVLGGARSGKSAFAEDLALASLAATPSRCARLVYIATAEAFDDEMQARIDLHKARRGPEWQLFDAPVELPEVIRANDTADSTILIDCTSIWTTNLLINELDISGYRDDLISAISAASGQIIVVASETGLGIIPDNKLSRQFRDANGLTNQAVAKIAHSVFFLVAGIAQKVKSTENP
ncbi:MAG: bifunctional adenosylcobinamide kinase/adenosylcobinamide-phosphate guanylyltransferase [Candidatus Puniceispirillum sp.]|nr:bifunctional adenosylcobinamide kinase/adenosylcobinamide-phosphate guanylyltransferase [Candidatus Puniceispirillum sp.]